MSAPRAKLTLTAAKAEPPRAEDSHVARAKVATPPSRLGKRLIGGHFPRSTWVTLRELGTEHDKSTQDLLQEALDDLFAKYRKS